MYFANNELYNRVINITYEYLGPVSKRCIDRQIVHHLGKRPEEMNEDDLKSLISWIQAVSTHLTGDKQAGSELAKRLESLTCVQQYRSR